MEKTPKHLGRLAMLDEHGHRQFIIPAEVRGFYHSAKKKIHFILICLFLALPWIHIQQKQLVLLNIPQRQFHLFGLELFAYDAPLIFFLVISFAVGLALATALFGRIWCGWACPQTVFIETIYRQIERWTEGNYIERRKMQQEEMSFRKFRKVSLKWLLYLLISSLIAHSFIAYFTGSKELLLMIQGSPRENFSYFLMVFAMTVLLLFNFGWFREQFCVIMCPYGKLQSVLMDGQTVTVMYDSNRGEPRKGLSPKDQQGDCVACNRCVQVCPTKIDIRNGVQLECIACTACIDACDEIMTKVNKPKGLIRYKSFTEKPVNWLRSRVILYSTILLACIVGFSLTLAFSSPLRVELLRAHNTPFQVRPTENGETLSNQFLLRLENHGTEIRLSIETQPNIKVVMPENPLVIHKGQIRDIPVFFETDPRNLKAGRLEVILKIIDADKNQILAKKRMVLVGPDKD